MSVIDVASYILQRVGPVTTMKLQKLCYYAQAWSLAWDEEPLFPEDFEAWANGPVCPRLFNTHRGLFRVDAGHYAQHEPVEFTKDQIETMNAMIDFYGEKTPQWLSELTHAEDPWRLARVGCPPGESCSNIITKESMQQYYGGL